VSTAPTALPPVHALLVRACRRTPPPLAQEDLALLADARFRAALRDLAERHRVSGLALATLARDAGLHTLPREARDDLLAPLAGLRARAERQERELPRLLGVLRAGGLDPLVLKGPALRRTVYASPVERRFGDFDLLLPGDRIERALALAGEAGYRFPFSDARLAGYRARHFHVIVRHPERFVAELHWALSPPGSPFQLDAAAFERRSVRLAGPGGGPLRAPCPEHLLLHMAHEHLLRDSFSRLVRVVDVDRIVAAQPGLDWDEVVSSARRGGLSSLLGLSLELAAELFETEIPPDVRRALRAPALARVHTSLAEPARGLLEQRLADVGVRTSLLFWLASGWRRRAKLLARLLTGREYAEQWIFDAEERGPAGGKALLAGVKTGLRAAGYHAALYGRALADLGSRGGRR
jgi:Uncharacterised nucleotidyltransferase